MFRPPTTSTTKGTVSHVTTRHHKNSRHNIARQNDHFSANFFRFHAPNHCAKQQETENISSTQPTISHAVDAVTTSTHSFFVLSVFLFLGASSGASFVSSRDGEVFLRLEHRTTNDDFLDGTQRGLDQTHHAQFCERFRRESQNSARWMECGLSLKSLSRPRIRVLCRWSCGQCCVRGSVFLLSRSTWPQTRQAQTSSLHRVLVWHVSQWW